MPESPCPIEAADAAAAARSVLASYCTFRPPAGRTVHPLLEIIEDCIRLRLIGYPADIVVLSFGTATPYPLKRPESLYYLIKWVWDDDEVCLRADVAPDLPPVGNLQKMPGGWIELHVTSNQVIFGGRTMWRAAA